MKKFKFGLLALVFTVGIGGAVVQRIHAAPKVIDPTYDWVDANGSNPLMDKTVSFAQSAYSCSSGTATCATGVLSDDSPVSGPENQRITKAN